MKMDKDKEKIQTLLQQIRDESSDAEYIYRGETQKFPKISSTLYRKYEDKIAANKFDIDTAQTKVLENVEEYISFDENIDILIELQHYGGKTNLIDFSTDYLIALFFACDAQYNKDGRLILLKKNTTLGNIITPRNITTSTNKNVRIISQKSIFFEPPEGFIEEEKVKEEEKIKEVKKVKEVEKVKIVPISQELKQPIISYLKKYHRITTESIYSDLLGYIQNQDKHQKAETQFYIGLTHQYKAEEHQQAGKHAKEAREELNKAIAAYTKAIKLKPDYASAYYNRGTAKAALGQYPEAIIDYTTAIELKPDNAEAYNNRGVAQVELGQYPEAITDHTVAIKLKPDYASAYNNRGIAKAWLKQYPEAIADYNTAIELNPDDAATYFNRGVAQAELRQYKEASADYTTAIKLNPDYAAAYIGRSVAKEGLGQHQQARADYTVAMNLAKKQGDQTLINFINQTLINLRNKK